MTADREWVYLAVDRQIGDCKCEGRHICLQLREGPIEGARVCMPWWNWCITTPDTHIQYARISVCAGENTITHHVDWALGRSLLRRESGENRFNEQQVTEREVLEMRGKQKKVYNRDNKKRGGWEKKKRNNWGGERVKRGEIHQRICSYWKCLNS